jgi:hypothetical protein
MSEEINELKQEYNILSSEWKMKSEYYLKEAAEHKNDPDEYSRINAEKLLVLNRLTEQMISIQDKIRILTPKPVAVEVKDTKVKKGKKSKKSQKDEEDDEEEDEVTNGY